jgi:hypothetical protein
MRQWRKHCTTGIDCEHLSAEPSKKLGLIKAMFSGHIPGTRITQKCQHTFLTKCLSLQALSVSGMAVAVASVGGSVAAAAFAGPGFSIVPR